MPKSKTTAGAAPSGETALVVCDRCGEAKPIAALTKDMSRPGGVRSRCRSCSSQMAGEWCERPGNRERKAAVAKARRLAIKVEGLAHYGGVCACCGEADVRFLTFDHIDGGGKRHMAEIGGSQLIRWLRRNDYPEGFQVLCFNCNSGCAINGGICPHQDPSGRVVC